MTRRHHGIHNDRESRAWALQTPINKDLRRLEHVSVKKLLEGK